MGRRVGCRPGRAGAATRPAATLATTRGGPFGWVPLMYLVYARAPLNRSQDEVLAAATLLLEAGADPNAGYLWCGMSTPFTVLTGVFGEGSRDRAAAPTSVRAGTGHTAARARSAPGRPADALQPDVPARRLAPGAAVRPWPGRRRAEPVGARLGEAMETREQMWQRQLDWAAEHGFTDRLDLLARHGIDVSGVERRACGHPDDPNVRDEQGATPLHHAAWEGDIELIQRLLDAGADPTITDLRFGIDPVGMGRTRLPDRGRRTAPTAHRRAIVTRAYSVARCDAAPAKPRPQPHGPSGSSPSLAEGSCSGSRSLPEPCVSAVATRIFIRTAALRRRRFVVAAAAVSSRRRCPRLRGGR